MKPQHAAASIAIACLIAGGCKVHNPLKAAPPTGEVVATVDGEEITQRQLRAELAGLNAPTDPKALKAAEQQALQMIIVRKLLAKAAETQGLDKTPDFALQKQRTEEALLAETLQTNLAAAVPAPTSEEAEAYISSHPDEFAQRKIFTVDQIRIARPPDSKMLDEIKPLNTMDDIAALLTREKVDFRRGTDGLDALTVDPDVVDKILKLPPNEVFVIPGNAGLLINQIKSTQITPFTGPQATAYTLALLKRQHTQEAVNRQISAIVTRDAGSVRYNPAYQPPLAKAVGAAEGGKASAG